MVKLTPINNNHYEHDGQRKRTKYTVPQVDKGTSLHFYYVKMCRTGEYACDTCSTHFYIIAVKECSFVYLRNCIFCPLSLSVMFIVNMGILITFCPKITICIDFCLKIKSNFHSESIIDGWVFDILIHNENDIRTINLIE